MPNTEKAYRYNSPAIILHWLMALGFFIMLGSGIIMTYFEISQSFKFNLYQWHKSGGVLLFISFGLRLIWRFISTIRNQIPALPKSFAKTEIIAAKIGHWLLYALMLGMPLTGWLMVSASVYGLPTIVFGWFEWPHIPNIQGNETIISIAKNLHFYFAIFFSLTISIHIAAVIKHKIIDNENLMYRIWWTQQISTGK